jgi:hypothetical protein
MKNSYLSILAIILSVVSIVLYFFKFGPIQIDPIGYFGMTAAFIAVSVTLLVGFQIYNYFEIKNDVDLIKKKANEIDSFKEQMDKQSNKISAHLLYLAGTIANTNKNYLYAINLNIGCLLYTINSEEENWVRSASVLFDNLKSLLPEITRSAALRYDGDPSYFDTTLNSIQEYDNKIRESENFKYIEERYEKFTRAFHRRFENFKEGNPVDKDELTVIEAI